MMFKDAYAKTNREMIKAMTEREDILFRLFQRMFPGVEFKPEPTPSGLLDKPVVLVLK